MKSKDFGRILRQTAADFIAGLIIFFIVLALALYDSDLALSAPAGNGNGHQTTAQPGPIRTALVRPGDMNSGALLLKSTVPGQYVIAPRLATDVDIDVTGIIARAVVTQRFVNPGDGWVEGIYVFPLPENSAVDTLRMQIGKRFIEGQIKPRQEAREIYEKAKQEGKKASLIEQQRPNVFTNSVANIGPGETVIVQIEYQQSLDQDNGVYSLRFPLVVAPRYHPEASPPVKIVTFQEPDRPHGYDFELAKEEALKDSVREEKEIAPPVLHPSVGKTNPVSLHLKLKAAFVIGEIKSHHHPIAIERTSETVALIGLAEGAVPADKDFELTWSAKTGNAPSTTLFYEKASDENYLLAMVSPPEIDPSFAPPPREVIFVLDNSGSMAGASIRQAKASLLLALSRLKPRDKFNVIRFDNTHELLFVSAVTATEQNVAIAKRFVANISADGGTEMLPALSAALLDSTPDDDSRIRQVVFLTDGAIANEAQLFSEIATKRGRSRIFTVGIGSAPNSYFMRRAAEIGRGTFTHIGAASQVRERMIELFRKLETPVMTGLTAKWTSGQRVESWPDPLPDLYAGEPIIITAKIPILRGSLELSGTFAGRVWTSELDLQKAASGPGVAQLWARTKIASLEARRYSGLNWKTIDKDIESIALNHHLVSRLTSLVAVDVTPSRPEEQDLASKDIPLNLPDGWNFEKVFGEENAPRIEQATLDKYKPLMKFASAQTKPTAKSATTTRGLRLPQGATLADRKILIGVLALLFATMCAFTFGFWRHLRREYASPRRRLRRRI